jgi:hypothetical protein
MINMVPYFYKYNKLGDRIKIIIIDISDSSTSKKLDIKLNYSLVQARHGVRGIPNEGEEAVAHLYFEGDNLDKLIGMI